MRTAKAQRKINNKIEQQDILSVIKNSRYKFLFLKYFILQNHEENKFEIGNLGNKLIQENCRESRQ